MSDEHSVVQSVATALSSATEHVLSALRSLGTIPPERPLTVEHNPTIIIDIEVDTNGFAAFEIIPTSYRAVAATAALYQYIVPGPVTITIPYKSGVDLRFAAAMGQQGFPLGASEVKSDGAPLEDAAIRSLRYQSFQSVCSLTNHVRGSLRAANVALNECVLHVQPSAYFVGRSYNVGLEGMPRPAIFLAGRLAGVCSKTTLQAEITVNFTGHGEKFFGVPYTAFA